MSMNIKNEETHALARELAELTGESVTSAVTIAVKDRLVRLRREREDLKEWLLAIGKDCASRIPEPYRSIDHGELLYDDRGLPR